MSDLDRVIAGLVAAGRAWEYWRRRAGASDL